MIETEDNEGLIESDFGADETSKVTFQNIQQMSIMEKIKLASLGNKEIRRMLLRDPAKAVQRPS